MIRAVLAIVLASALLAASMPVVEQVRQDRADVAAREAIETVERAASGLAETEEPGAGARRLVTVTLPPRTWASAGVDSLRFRPNGTVAWTIADRRQVRHTETIPIRPSGDRPLVLERSGRTRLVVELRGTPGEPVATVRRFNPEEEANPGHARSTP